MKLVKARIRNYRSIRDTGEFNIENDKTILVGPNEAGKTAVLRALQQIKPPESVQKFNALRDYPRALYNDITTGKVTPETTPVVTGWFEFTDDEKSNLPEDIRNNLYEFTRYLDNSATHRFVGSKPPGTIALVRSDLLRFAKHLDKECDDEPSTAEVNTLLEGQSDTQTLSTAFANEALKWVLSKEVHFDENNDVEKSRFEKLKTNLILPINRAKALFFAESNIPIFVLFNNYFKVRPIIHLKKLADREENQSLDEDWFDYGNQCLMKLLGFSARVLSDLGIISDSRNDDIDEFENNREQLDKRNYQLNAASVKLTKEIRDIWRPSANRPEADKLRIVADGQYMKVVVEDDLGVEIELDQRSEGFQWMVSFFTVFFAEAQDKHENAILLLDEPGMSLHALKQRQFRETISRLAQENQTIFTTHSPFLVGPNELDLVRVVEMPSREAGTQVHTTITSTDPAAILPLQEALGYDLASTLFSSKRNLVLEGLTDYWYLQALSDLANAEGKQGLPDNISLVPASSAGKVVYFATILHSNNLKVAALLDSDKAGDDAAKQDTLVHTLGNNRILRTADFMPKESSVKASEIEDLIRDTLANVAFERFGVDVSEIENKQKSRPIIDLFEAEIPEFSKYQLAKAFLRWSKDHDFSDLKKHEAVSILGLLKSAKDSLK